MTSMVISLGAPLFLRGATRQESTIFLFFLATVNLLKLIINLTIIIKKSERFVTSFIMVANLVCWTDFTKNLFLSK